MAVPGAMSWPTPGSIIWGLDFQGFGNSDPYPEMDVPAERNPSVAPKLRARRSNGQPTSFVTIIGVPKISIIAHSWGTIATGRFAGSCPDQVERLVFFGPFTWRPKKAEPQSFPAWRLVSFEDQWDRFTVEVPPGESAVFSKRHFEEWGPLYLDTDALARERQDAKRAVARHRRRRRGRSRLRP
jgi:pimeloyl-ACP methyl ester carboxylesterase